MQETTSPVVTTLQIPAVQHSNEVKSGTGLRWWQKCWRWWSCSLPTADQLRWPIQAGAAAGLSSLFLTFLPASEEFFGSSGVIGTAVTVVALEGTAGGSLRRGWLMALAGLCGAAVGFGVAALCLLPPDDAFQFVLALSVAVLVIPVAYLRYFKPTLNVGTNFGLSTSETVLLAAFAGAGDPWENTWLRALASVIGPLCTAVVSQFVMRKAARPTAANSLAKILRSIGDILERLATSLGTEVSICAFPSSYMLHSKNNNFPVSHKTAIHPSGALSSGDLRTPQRYHTGVFTSTPAVDQRYCAGLVASIETCQKLLAGQKALIQSASQEISFTRPYRFPVKVYEAIVSDIRNLFFHIASLVFALNLYVSSVLNLPAPQSKNALRSKSVPPSRFKQRICSEAELQSPLLSSALSLAGESDMFSEIEGASIGKVARHIAGALSCIADCLKERRAIDTPVRLHITMATEAIAEMNSRRQQQRDAFAQVLFSTLTADVTGSWNTSRSLDWTSALGLSASAYLKLSEDDKLLYWDAYWLDRDRISTSCATLTTLKDSLLNLCNLIDNYADTGQLRAPTHVIPLLP